MKRFTAIAIGFVIVYAAILSQSFAQTPLSTNEQTTEGDSFFFDQLTDAIAGALTKATELTPQEVTDTDLVVWHPTLESAIDDARRQGKPILVVVGAPWCGYCEKLHDDLEGEAETALSKQWVLAKINADDEVNDARELHVNGLPALRLLSSDGVTAASQDGYLPIDQLTQWLDQNYQVSRAQMPGLLAKDIEELDESEIETLISLMAVRDVTARRVVLNRLSEMPQQSVHQTIDLFASGNLAHQLSALHLLQHWKAPVDGLDPWEPVSIDHTAIDRLKAWETENYPVEPSN